MGAGFDKVQEKATHIVQHDADKEVERDSEKVDDSRPHLLRYMLTPHLHHARPEQTDSKLKHTECHQLQLALECDSCTERST